jgi:hypothetical protein
VFIGKPSALLLLLGLRRALRLLAGLAHGRLSRTLLTRGAGFACGLLRLALILLHGHDESLLKTMPSRAGITRFTSPSANTAFGEASDNEKREFENNGRRGLHREERAHVTSRAAIALTIPT